MDVDLNFPIEKIKEVVQSGDLVLLTSPHNPSGKTIIRDELLDLYMEIVNEDAYLLVDILYE